jgi:hypothetical protein
MSIVVLGSVHLHYVSMDVPKFGPLQHCVFLYPEVSSSVSIVVMGSVHLRYVSMDVPKFGPLQHGVFLYPEISSCAIWRPDTPAFVYGYS